jgi:hypothetical protein
MIEAHELFLSVRARWPDAIALGGSLIENSDVTSIPALTEIYDRIESSIEADDEWTCLAAWAFHQALTAFSKRRVLEGKNFVHSRDVGFDEFDAKMKENLRDPSWSEIRSNYDPSLD